MEQGRIQTQSPLRGEKEPVRILREEANAPHVFSLYFGSEIMHIETGEFTEYPSTETRIGWYSSEPQSVIPI